MDVALASCSPEPFLPSYPWPLSLFRPQVTLVKWPLSTGRCRAGEDDSPERIGPLFPSAHSSPGWRSLGVCSQPRAQSCLCQGQCQ